LSASSRGGSWLRAFAWGLIPTAIGVGVSLAVAWWGYGHLYYMGTWLPAFMGVYVLSAWLIYLRRSTYLLARSRPPGGARTALVLLCSALQLALLSTALYYLLGVGAGFRFTS